VRGLDLSSYLLIPSKFLYPISHLSLGLSKYKHSYPVQRITRYPLLIRQILHHTSPDPESEFMAVQRSLEEVESITAGVNESVRAAEGDERLRVLSEDLWIGGEG